MALPKYLTTVTPFSKVLAMIIFIAFPIIGFIFGMQYQAMLYDSIQLTKQNKTEITSTQQPLNNSCKKSSLGEASDILVKYTVTKGDSLLSIARNQLGDPSRYQEVAVMNGDKYSALFSSPGIIAQNPFLEQGWVLLLPPKWITNSSGQLDEINGVIYKIRSNDQALMIANNREQSQWDTVITLDKNTINKSNTVYKEGNCITAVRDIRLNKVFKIDLQ